MRILISMILMPGALLAIWIISPVAKTIAQSIVSDWGVAVGLDGFALALANAMPYLVPLICLIMIFVGLVGAIRGGSNV